MDSPSDSGQTLTVIAQELFPELEREVGQAMDELRSSENRLKRIPRALLQNGSSVSRDKAIHNISTACEDLVFMLKSLHQQYPQQ